MWRAHDTAESAISYGVLWSIFVLRQDAVSKPEAKDGLFAIAPRPGVSPGTGLFHHHGFLHARRAIGELRRLNDCAMVTSLAWVVMPDHLHWLLALGHGHSIPIVAKMLMGRTATAINRDGARRGPVWQRAFFDHALRRDEDAAKVARYIVANPLRAGLVTKLGDYPHWDAIWL